MSQRALGNAHTTEAPQTVVELHPGIVKFRPEGLPVARGEILKPIGAAGMGHQPPLGRGHFSRALRKIDPPQKTPARFARRNV